MANINGKVIPGGVDWSGIANALYNTLQAPYNYRQNQLQTQPGGDNYIDPDDVGGTVFGGSNASGAGSWLDASGSTSNSKDQSQLSPGQALAFDPNATGAQPATGLAALPAAAATIASYQTPPPAFDPLRLTVGPANMIQPQAPVVSAQPAVGLAAMAGPAARPAARSASPLRLTVGPANVLRPTGGGGGTPAPMTVVQQYQAQGLSPSQAYAAAAAPALASQPNGNRPSFSGVSPGGSISGVT